MYGGESNAKKLARLQFWLDTLHLRLHAIGDVQKLDRLRALVLAGPEAADVRTLHAMDVPLKNITAVDINRSCIESSAAVLPGANYVCADVHEVARKARRGYDVVFLDFCCPLSAKTVDQAVSIASLALKDRGVFGMGVMYGRENPTAREHIGELRESLAGRVPRDDRERLVQFVADMVASEPAAQRLLASTGRTVEETADWMMQNMPGKRESDAALAKATRGRFAVALVLERARRLGFLLHSASFYFYRSGRRVKERSVGTPMMYYAAICHRPMRRVSAKTLSRQGMRLIAMDNITDGGYLLHDFGDDPDGEDVKKAAVQYARILGSTRTAELLNLKPGTVASWLAWDTTRRQRVEDGGAENAKNVGA